MQLRPDRLIIGAMAWITIAASALFLFYSEQQLARAKPSLQAFDLRARETIDTMGDLRAAQQAYVAAGQGVAFWVAKVATTGDVVRSAIAGLRESATADAARAALDKAADALNQFTEADKGALDFINQAQPLMASDVIFSEGSLAATTVAHFIEQARLADYEGVEAMQASARKREALVMGVAATLIGFIVLVLTPLRDRNEVDAIRDLMNQPKPDAQVARVEPVQHTRAIHLQPARPVAVEAPPRANADPTDDMRLVLDSGGMDRIAHLPPPGVPPGFLKSAAELATDFGRVRDMADLHELVARTATMIDASGIVVWMASPNKAELRPLLTHGYSPQMVARLAAVPRGANNAAAAAFRSGSLQMVMSEPGSAGALVVPIHSVDGCIGALAAEMRGGESSERVHALVAIVSAHLANVLTAEAVEPVDTIQIRAAAQA